MSFNYPDLFCEHPENVRSNFEIVPKVSKWRTLGKIGKIGFECQTRSWRVKMSDKCPDMGKDLP